MHPVTYTLFGDDMNPKYKAFLLISFLLSILVCFACSSKSEAPANDSAAQANQEKPKTMVERKADYQDATNKAAKLREEAAALRATGTAADEKKAVELEAQAAQMEQKTLEALPAGINAPH